MNLVDSFITEKFRLRFLHMVAVELSAYPFNLEVQRWVS